MTADVHILRPHVTLREDGYLGEKLHWRSLWKDDEILEDEAGEAISSIHQFGLTIRKSGFNKPLARFQFPQGRLQHPLNQQQCYARL